MWHVKAAEAKTAHRVKYPSYSYSPRKAGEKRRRLTKRQAAYNTAVKQYGSEPVIKHALTTGSVLESNVTGDAHTGRSPFNIPLDDPMVHHIHFDTELPHPNTMVVPVLEGLIDAHNDSSGFSLNHEYLPSFNATDSNAGNEQFMPAFTQTITSDVDVGFNSSDDIFGSGTFNNYSLGPLDFGLYPQLPPPQSDFAEINRQLELDAIAHTFYENADEQSKDKSDKVDGTPEDKCDGGDNEKSDKADDIDWESMVEFEDAGNSN